MTLKIDLSTIINFEEKESFVKRGNIYQARKSTEFGLSASNEFIVGLTLVAVSEGNWYDALQENISNIGNEFVCHLPEEGFIEGAYYMTEEVCTSTDWETGYCDDTEVYIRRVL